MTEAAPIDRDAAHRYFAAACFNETWELLDKAERTSDEDRLMIAASLASVYHWSRRPDCAPQHLSVGYWQVSRVHAVLKRAQEALHYADLCESYSRDLSPFYRGYAWEAIARAATLAGQPARAELAKTKALELLAQITDPAECELLAQDLAMV